jgi:methyl-accepting chemotaxis protein
MSTVAKRRIQVASFSMSDISRGHMVSMVIGVLLIAGSAALAVASNSNARASADSKGAARLLSTAAGQVLQGAQTYVGGGSERLSSAVAGTALLDAGFADVVGSANSVVVLPTLKQPAADAYGAWGSLKDALSQLALPASLSAELSEALGREVGHFASLVKKLETAGKSTSTYAKSYESAVRLYTYAESGFGPASVARVDYDLQVLASEMSASEFRQDAAFLTSLIASAHQAAAKKVTKEQLSAAYEAAKQAKTFADQLGGAASQAQGALWLGVGAAVLALFGLAGIVGGLRSASSEFSKRYARSVQQFRGDEAAREQLVAGLRAATEGELSAEISVPASSGEFAEIAQLVNHVLELVRERLGTAAAAMTAGVESGNRVLQVAEQARESGQSVMRELDAAAQSLSECSTQSDAIALDTRAMLTAADEAAARSADATRVAQDAASRLEAMRDGLQDTSKRIKRLGERSQEINAVVESLELLSEQIGVLALNASLEAERAGDAGAGFRLVAKEVQALAQRSEDALERISGLVQGVQADARSAAESVERSTGQVVAGANVGAVSQALLSVLAPLAETISAMARSVADGAGSNAAAMSASVRAAEDVKRAAADVVGQVDSLRTPVEQGRRRLNSGLSSLADAQSAEALI